MKEIMIEKEKIGKKVADILAEAISKTIRNKDQVVVAFPGGRSVAAVFDVLKEKEIDWNNVHLFMVDERMVKLDNEDCNFKLLKEELIGHINIPEENVHPFMVEEGIKAYEEELKKVGGKFDIVLLSSGEDGHIAGLYPKHHSIKDESDYFITMDDSPKPPKDRMSSSRKLIEKIWLKMNNYKL